MIRTAVVNSPEVCGYYFSSELQTKHGAWDMRKSNERERLSAAKDKPQTVAVTPTDKKRKPMGQYRKVPGVAPPWLYKVSVLRCKIAVSNASITITPAIWLRH